MSNPTESLIRQHREAKGLTQAELAHRAGLGGPSIVSNAERGLAGPSVRKRLAEALGVRVEDLIDPAPTRQRFRASTARPGFPQTRAKPVGGPEPLAKPTKARRRSAAK